MQGWPRVFSELRPRGNMSDLRVPRRKNSRHRPRTPHQHPLTGLSTGTGVRRRVRQRRRHEGGVRRGGATRCRACPLSAVPSLRRVPTGLPGMGRQRPDPQGCLPVDHRDGGHRGRVGSARRRQSRRRPTPPPCRSRARWSTGRAGRASGPSGTPWCSCGTDRIPGTAKGRIPVTGGAALRPSTALPYCLLASLRHVRQCVTCGSGCAARTRAPHRGCRRCRVHQLQQATQPRTAALYHGQFDARHARP